MIELVPLGRSGVEVSRLILGTYLNFEDRSVNDVKELVDTAWTLGIRSFDTADIYGDGAAERALGEALRPYPRDAYTLIGKVGRLTSCGEGLRVGHVYRSIERTLAHLGTSRLDVLLAHIEDPHTSLAELAYTFDELIVSGKIRAWGTSGFRPLSVARLRHCSTEKGGMSVEQPNFSLVERWIENGLLPAARALDVGVIAHSTLAGGLLSGKYLPGKCRHDADASESAVIESSRRHRSGLGALSPREREQTVAICELAQGAGIEPAALALAWVLAQPGIHAAVVGARTPAQLQTLALAALPSPAGLQPLLAPLQVELDRRFKGPRRRRDRLRASFVHHVLSRL